MLHLRTAILLALALLLACVPVIGAVPGSVSATTFGAKGDGVTDDTAAIQKALDSLDGKGGIVNLPAGRYVLSAALRVPSAVTLLGEGARWENSATGLIVPKNGFSAVRLGNASGVKGLAISYPNNQDNDKPEAYPPAILLEGINPSVESIVFDCAWIGVSTPPGGGNAGQGMFRDLTGFVHKVGIHLSGCRDVNRIIDVHWFVGGKDGPGKAYYRDNRVGFEFGDVDGVLMDRCFIIGGKTFFHQLPVKDTPDAKPASAHSLGFHINECWIEDVDQGFVFEGATGFVLNSANILLRKGGVGVSVRTNGLFYNAVISGVQVRTFGQPVVGFEYTVLNPHPRNRLSIADCQVVDGAPALLLGPGAIRANIHDNHFQSVPDKPAIQIDAGADLLVITNNVLSSTQPILDNSGDKARKNISGNVEEK
jgi:hypothetical protein